MEIFLDTPNYIPDHVCKYDVNMMLSFEEVCEITDSRAYAINTIEKFNLKYASASLPKWAEDKGSTYH